MIDVTSQAWKHGVAESEKKVFVRGNHIDQDIWEAAVAAALHLYKRYFSLREREREREREPNSHEKCALLKCTDGSLKENGSLGSGRPSVSCR